MNNEVPLLITGGQMCPLQHGVLNIRGPGRSKFNFNTNMLHILAFTVRAKRLV